MSTKHLENILPLVVILIALAASSVVSVGTGYVGVVTRFGRVTGRVLEPGIHLVAPIDKVNDYDCRIKEHTFKQEAFSKDLQVVEVDLSLMTSMLPENAITVHGKIGPQYSQQVVVRCAECLKQIIAKYKADEIIEQRDCIRNEIIQQLTERVKDIVVVKDVVLANLGFSDVYEKAIEDKQVAQQAALKAKYELDKAKVEADKKVAVAEGDAKAKVVEAQAEAEAIKIKAEALKSNPDVLLQNAIDKWDGKAPDTLLMGAGSCPVANLINTSSK